MNSALRHQLALQRAQVLGLERRLISLNPQSVLARGYAVVSQPDGTILRRVGQAVPGERINVHVSDGEFPAEVLSDG